MFERYAEQQTAEAARQPPRHRQAQRQSKADVAEGRREYLACDLLRRRV
jgi:hypothetical protein